MPDIEIKRGYEVLPDNNVRFGVRITNNSDFAISDVEVILDYSESIFEIEGNKIQKLGTIPPTVPRTAKFILKPLGCVHKEEIGATVRYKDHLWKKHVDEMRPKEVHCVCPFLKEKAMKQTEFFALSKSGYSAEKGVNFENIDVDRMASFLTQTCRNRLYKVGEYAIENGRILYLSSEAIGEKAYYLLTAVIKEYEGLTQIMLRANSDKPHGINGFLIEILDNLRHVVETVQSAREIGIIKKEHVINIIDSVVQRTTFSVGGEAASVNIRESVVQRTEIKEDEEKNRQEKGKLGIQKAEEIQREELVHQESLHRQREEETRLQKMIVEKQKERRIEGKQEFVHLKNMAVSTAFAIIAIMAFVIVLVAYGITFVIESGSYPIQPYLIFFLFSVVLIIASIFFEKRGAVYPWSIFGGSIASAFLTSIITVSIGGLRYIWEKGLSSIGTDTISYAFGVSIVISFILFNFARHKL